MARFIVNQTFTSEDTGTEYFQGAIYEVDDKTAPLIEQWTAEGKVRDPDVATGEAGEDKPKDEDVADQADDDDEEKEEDEDDDEDDKDEPA